MRVVRERAWPIAVVAFIAYAVLASPYIVDGDNAELSTLAAIGGRAHPSGYPLYVMWLRLWAWLPVSAAHAAALATAVLGAAAIGVLHAACRAWGARGLSATVTAGLAAVAPLVLDYHSKAEVFALNNLVAALVLWLVAAHGPCRGARRGFVLGLVAGLGIANNLTCVALAPLGVIGVVRAVRESRISTLALAALGLVLGLVPYAYLFVADTPAAWGEVASLGDLLAFIGRRDFGAMSVVVDGASVPWATRLGLWLAALGRAWLWLPALAGLAVLGARLRRPVGESRAAWALLLISFALAGPVLAAQLDIDPRGVGITVLEKFYVLPILLLAPAVAAAIDLATARVTRLELATGLALAGCVVLAVAAAPALGRTRSPAMQRGVQNLLGALPGNAIVVIAADDQCFGSQYLQHAYGVRPDVSVICAGLLPTRWYRARWAAHGLATLPTEGAALADALLAAHRPLFVDPTMTRILRAYPHYPHTIVMRVLPRGAQLPDAHAIEQLDQALFAAFDLDYPHPGSDDGYPTIVHHRYAAAWTAVANRLMAAGDRPAAEAAIELTRALQPAD